MGEKFFFSVETLVLRHRQEIASLTVSRLHVSPARQVLCGCSADLVIYRFEVRFPLNAEILLLVNGLSLVMSLMASVCAVLFPREYLG